MFLLSVKSCLFVMSMQRCYRIIKEQHQTSIMASLEPSNNNYNEASRDVSQTTSGYIHFRLTLHPSMFFFKKKI